MKNLIALIILASCTADACFTEADALIDACLAAPVDVRTVPYPFNPILSYDCAKSTVVGPGNCLLIDGASCFYSDGGDVLAE